MNKSIDIKNKRIADASIIFLVMDFIVFIVIKMLFKNNQWWFELIGFTIEASLVGAIADWFAITALFEKPFLVGKIPFISHHTSIIPNNRDNIVDAVAKMVQNELLSEKVLMSKINDINIIDILIDFIDKNKNKDSEIYKKLVTYFTNIIEKIDTKEFSYFIEMRLKNKIRDTDLSVYLDKALSFIMKNNESQKIFNKLLDQLIEFINQDDSKKKLNIYINELIESQAKGSIEKIFLNIAKFFNGVNSSEASASILEEINKILLGLKDENSSIRIEVIKKLKDSIEKVNTDKVKKYIEEWKSETLEKSSIHENLKEIIDDVIKGLKVIIEEVFLINNSLDKYDESERYMLTKQDLLVVILWIKHKIEMYWNNFKTNLNIKEKINSYIKEFIFKFIESKYENVGNIVKKILNSMNDESLNNFILKKAGNDLHGIRINGCIMGAIFGIAVYALTNLIYGVFFPSILNIKL